MGQASMSAKPSATSDTSSEITDEVSKRMCQHMNEDHAVSVYAMAKSLVKLKPGFKLSGARIKKVTLSGCSIQAITCCNDACVPLDVVFPFDPPLQSASEARSRLVKVHQALVTPKVSWFVTKTLPMIVVPVWLFLIWASQIASKEELENVLGNVSLIQMLPMSPQDRLSNSKLLIDLAFFFTFFGHFFLSVFVADKAITLLKMTPVTLLLWMACVMISGYPFFAEFYDLYKVAKAAREKSRKAKQ